MSKLIDADVLREQTEKDAEYAFKNEFLDLYYERKFFVQRIDEQPIACDIDAIRQEIEKVCNEEKDIDVKWSQGLKYSLQIIDKHIKN